MYYFIPNRILILFISGFYGLARISSA